MLPEEREMVKGYENVYMNEEKKYRSTVNVFTKIDREEAIVKRDLK
jgi:hypothetical protein